MRFPFRRPNPRTEYAERQVRTVGMIDSMLGQLGRCQYELAQAEERLKTEPRPEGYPECWLSEEARDTLEGMRTLERVVAAFGITAEEAFVSFQAGFTNLGEWPAGEVG
jgi:hypothetical protein